MRKESLDDLQKIILDEISKSATEMNPNDFKRGYICGLRWSFDRVFEHQQKTENDLLSKDGFNSL